MQKRAFLIIILSCCLTWLQAQNRTVTGTVSDSTKPLAGASVVEKGVNPTNGVFADNSGRFSIILKGTRNILIITAANYLPREVNISNGSTNVLLTIDPKSLDEVIVVGFGRQKKITLTGAASQVSGAEIRENPSASLQNGLVGRLPGFSSQQRSGRPGADGAAFYIRGVNSTTGQNQPLIIVDDIQYSYDQFALLDANEVETITILKDAATTAVYGIKGANGVVVVTTRRGKAGRPRISFRSEYATMQPTVLPKYVDAYTSASMYNQAQKNDNFYGANVPNPVLQFTDADLQLYKDGTDPYGHPNTDWASVLLKKNSHQFRNNLDINGGTDKVKYFISLGYLTQGSILKDFSEDQGIDGNYYNKRFNYRSNLDIKASKTLDLRVDLYGANSEVNNPYVAGGKNDPLYELSSFLSLSPFSYPVKNPDGSWGYSIWQRNLANGGSYNYNNLVARLAQGGYQRVFTDNMNFITSANQKLDFITPGLSLKGLVSYSVNYNYGRALTRTNIPSFIYNSAGGTYAPRDPNVYTADKLSLGNNGNPGATVRTLNVQGYLTYDRTFGKHHFSGLGLISRNSIYQTNSNATYNFIPVNTQGITARVGYDYKQKYLVQFNGGYNGSDRFQASKKYGLFPAISAGWNVAEEGFFKKNIPVISSFKLRGSYGIVGSDAINSSFNYVYNQEYLYNTAGAQNTNTSLGILNNRIYQANFGFTSNPFTNLQEGTLGNNDVSWEKECKLDLGVDFSLLKGKLSGSADYFNNNRYDILTNRQDVSYIFGQALPIINLGKSNNKGYEFELGYNDRIGKNVTYSVKGMYAYAINKIIYQGEPANILSYQKGTGQSIGQPLIYLWSGTYYQDAADVAKSPSTTGTGGIGAVHAGNLKYVDINGDGLINDKDRGFFGRPNLPTTTYSFQFRAGYKGLNLDLLFQGSANFSVYFTSEAIRPFTANIQEVHTQSWTPQLGNNALFPILSLTSNPDNPAQFNSTFWYRSGNFLRLRTASISYSLPKKWISKLKIDNLQFYVNGNNLFTWAKIFDLYSIDPEGNPGNDRLPYPVQKLVNLGASITF